MTYMLISLVLASLIAGILLRSAVKAVLLVGLVLGTFWLSCYAFNISPRAVLTTSVHAARHEWKAHRKQVRGWLQG